MTLQTWACSLDTTILCTAYSRERDKMWQISAALHVMSCKESTPAVLLALSLRVLPCCWLSPSLEAARRRMGGEKPPSSASWQPSCCALLCWLRVITPACTDGTCSGRLLQHRCSAGAGKLM